MKAFRILALLAAAAIGAFTAGQPARAGGWAVTYLDPAPATIQTGKSYTVGYWVLQHGSHPYDGDLGTVGLTLVDERGQRTTFAGIRLPEQAHYATALAVPHPGRWEVIANQGVFAEYRIGTLTVPGALVAAPTPSPMPFHDGHQHSWTAIRPPLAAANAEGAAATGPDTSGSPAAAALPPTPRRGNGPWWLAAFGTAAVTLIGTGLLARRPLAGVARAAWRSRPRRGVRAA